MGAASQGLHDRGRGLPVLIEVDADQDTGEILGRPQDDPLWLLRQLERPFPGHLIRSKGRYPFVGIRDIQARLDAVTAGAWSWRLHGEGHWIETEQRRDGKIVAIRSFVTTGTICIPGLGSKDGRGVQDVDETKGLSTSGIILGADSRALRNAAERIGLWKPGDDE